MDRFRSNFPPLLLPPAGRLVDHILRSRCGIYGRPFENSNIHDPVSRIGEVHQELMLPVFTVSGLSWRHLLALAVHASQVVPRDGSREDTLAGDAGTSKSWLLPS